MKKILSIALMALAILATGCGSSKNANSFDGNQAVNNPPAITKALEKPASRAYGSATQFDLGFATRTAAASARQELAAHIRSVLSSNTNINRYAYQQYASDGKNAATGKDEESKTQELVEAIVPEVDVNGSVIIENNIYKTRDGQYQVFVCVEYQGDAYKMASQLADGYRKYLEQRVSEEDRANIDQKVQEFQEETYNRIKEINGK